MVCDFEVDNIRFQCDGDSLHMETAVSQISVSVDDAKTAFEMIEELINSQNNGERVVNPSDNILVRYQKDFLIQIVKNDAQINIFDQYYYDVQTDLINYGVI
jgi:hypothetical protein